MNITQFVFTQGGAANFCMQQFLTGLSGLIYLLMIILVLKVLILVSSVYAPTIGAILINTHQECKGVLAQSGTPHYHQNPVLSDFLIVHQFLFSCTDICPKRDPLHPITWVHPSCLIGDPPPSSLSQG